MFLFLECTGRQSRAGNGGIGVIGENNKGLGVGVEGKELDPSNSSGASGDWRKRKQCGT